MLPHIADTIFRVAYVHPFDVAGVVAEVLDPIIVMARQLGHLDQANYMSEIQRNLLLRYPHRRFRGLPAAAPDDLAF